MAEFIFLPVPTPEMHEMAQEICDARVGAGMTAPMILRNFYDSGVGKGWMRATGHGCGPGGPLSMSRTIAPAASSACRGTRQRHPPAIPAARRLMRRADGPYRQGNLRGPVADRPYPPVPG